MKLPSFGEIRKFVVAVSGGVGEAITLGVLHGTAEHYATLGIGIATAVLTYLVPNDAPATPAPPVAPPVAPAA